MTKQVSFSLLLFCILLSLGSCLDPYSPPVSSENIDILVIEGFLNSTDNSAVVKLSKATPLSSTTLSERQKGATVTIEDESGAIFNLEEQDSGIYTLENMNINIQNKYQLHIKTGNKEYRSDYIELKVSPPLDSITWKAGSNGVTIYTNTHDESARTQFYQWTFQETWEYNSDYFSAFKIVGDSAVPRPPSENINQCWTTIPSSKISIYSTNHLSSDQVSNFPLFFIEGGSRRISKKYSILVQQRALTEEAYSYLLQLQKTTESIGGLFDPLPYQLTGNVHNVNDSSEPVVGFFNGGSIQEKRLFINASSLPSHLLYHRVIDCPQDTIPVSEVYLYTSATLLTTSLGDPIITDYLTSSSSCVDCRLAGGTTTKPDFWQ